MDGGSFKRGSTGASDFDISYRLAGAGIKTKTSITNRIDFNAGTFAVGSRITSYNVCYTKLLRITLKDERQLGLLN